METTLTEATKREQGYDWPASAFLYVPDADKPSEWKLRFKELVNGRPEVTKAQLGRAAAALGKGFRGQKVELPAEAKAACKRKLRGLYRKLGVKPEDMPPAIREDRIDPEDGVEDILYENLNAFTATKIDRETATIKDVVLAGPQSKNGRRYLTRALAEAVPLYEGVRVCLNHTRAANDTRDVRDIAGWVTGVRLSEGKVKGTLNILPAHAWLLDIAERNPDLLGMSHMARGILAKEGEETIVERILSVRSVDVVSDPATTKNLFENVVGSLGQDPQDDKEDEEMTLTEIRERHPDLIEEIQKEITKQIEESDAAKAKEAEVRALKEENETLKKAQAVTETARLVEAALSSADQLPAKVKDRIRKGYEGMVAEKAAIEKHIAEVKAIGAEFMESAGTRPRIQITRSDRDGNGGRKERTVAESAIFRLCGVTLNDETKKGKED